MTMGENIKRLRIEKGMTQEELGRILGVQKSAIRKYESGKVENIPRSSIKKMAEIFGVRPSFLMGWDEDLPSFAIPVTKRRFPVLGNVACGEPIYADEERGTFVDASADINADFCLIAKGDSMINARIFDGDLLFIKKQETVENGEIAVVLVEDEATVKRV